MNFRKAPLAYLRLCWSNSKVIKIRPAGGDLTATVGAPTAARASHAGDSRRGPQTIAGAIACLIIAIFAASTAAQLPYQPWRTNPDGSLIKTVPSGQTCDANGDQSAWAGWQSDLFLKSFIDPTQRFQGFPMNVSLAWGVGPADLPPKSTNFVESSSPIISKSPSYFEGVFNYPSRALAGGEIDLVTGAPLVQEIDFELPFGSAIYRHVRTLGEQSNSFWHEEEALRNLPWRQNGVDSELLWDWNGQGWMIGENPLLLFDACYLGISAKPATASEPAFEQRITYFIPDAHHSIPFVRNDDGTYTAPPQFDAALICADGTWDSTTKEWTIPPTRVDVWLQKRTVHYQVEIRWYTDSTGKPRGENVPVFTDASGVRVDLHASPVVGNPALRGEGMPYIGLTKSISDRRGNRVLLEYTPLEQYEAAEVPDLDPNDGTPSVKVCHQNTPEFGQLRTAKLFPADVPDSGTPTWTIVFTYRDFFDNSIAPLDNTQLGDGIGADPSWYCVPGTGNGENSCVARRDVAFRKHRQTAIHSIHVYAGSVVIPPSLGTIADQTFSQAFEALRNNGTYLHPADDWDAYDSVTPQSLFGLSNDWVYCVTYAYSHPKVPIGRFTGLDENTQVGTDTALLYPWTWLGTSTGTQWFQRAPRLVHRCVKSKLNGASGTTSELHWLYQWENVKTPYGVHQSGMLESQKLGMIFDPSTIERMLAGMRKYSQLEPGEIGYQELHSQSPAPWREPSRLSVNDLLVSPPSELIPVIGSDGKLVEVNRQAGVFADVHIGFLEQSRWAKTRYERPGYLGPGLSFQEFPPNNLLRSIRQEWLSESVLIDYCLQLCDGVAGSSIENNVVSQEGYQARRTTRIARFLVSQDLITEVVAAKDGSTPIDEYSAIVKVGRTRLGGGYGETAAESVWCLYPPEVWLSSEKSIAQFGRGLLHHPYNFVGKASDLWPDFGTGVPQEDRWMDLGNAGNTVWLAIISESQERRLADDGDGQPGPWEMVNAADGSGGAIRIVEMNKAGIVLRDTTFKDTGRFDAQGNQVILPQSPSDQLREEVIYDQLTHTRVIERRTASWTCLENVDNRPSDGLIYVNGYNYPPLTSGASGLPRGSPTDDDPHIRETSPPASPVEGFQSPQLTMRLEYEGFKIGEGSGSDTVEGVYAIRAYAYSDARPDLVTRVVEFAEPRPVATGLDPSPSDRVSWFYYAYEPEPQDRPQRRNVSLKTTVYSAVRRDNTGTLAKYIVNELSDRNGNLICEWKGYRAAQSVADSDPVTGDLLSHTAWSHSYDANGNRVSSYISLWDGSLGGSAGPSVSPAWAMAFGYDLTNRPIWTKEADGTYSCFSYRPDDLDPGITIRRTYSRINSATRRVGAPVLEERVRAGQVELQIALRIDEPIHFTVPTDGGAPYPDPVGDEAGVELYRTVATRDPFGRLNDVQRRGAEAPIAAVNIAYDSFGQACRLEDSGGTIVRTVHDNYGRVKQIFRGSNDQHEVWGTTVANEDPCNAVYPDTMTLVERREFGYGVRSAGQVIAISKYRDRPLNQYRLVGCEGTPSNNEDAIGIVERHQFDSRLRDVWAATYPDGNSSTQATKITTHYFDNLNRERFTAVFSGDATISGDADPRGRAIASPVPTPSEILAAHPLKLTEKRYDCMDRVIETRIYDVTVADGTSYTAARSVMDEAGRVVWQLDSGGRITETVYNGAGWIDHAVTGASDGSGGLTEVEKTSYAYDAAGNVIEIVRLERTHDGTGNVLSAANSIQTRTFQWFDWRHNLIASAQLGTEDTGNQFITRTSGAVSRVAFAGAPCAYDGSGRLVGIAAIGLPSSALVMCYEYDIENRQIGMVDANGSVTRTEYDALGRVLSVTNNALAAAGSSAKQITAYKYDTSGRLSRMAAVKTGESAAGINWDATDGSIEVTAVDYGAAVKNPTGGVLFTDGDLLAAIRFPDATTGQPATNGLAYSYLLTGEVAERIDQRTSSRLGYGYDERGNLTTIDVTAPTKNLQTLAQPVDEVGHVDFSYDAAGRMVQRRTFAIPTSANTPPDSIEKGIYQYDGRGNLAHDYQQHGLDVISQSPVVDYVRQYISDSATSSLKNVDRLTKIVYPDRDLAGATGLRRQIQMGYGTTSGIDDSLSRIVDMQEVGNSQHLATFAYAGESRRVDFGLGVTFTSTGPQSYVARSFARGTSFSGVGYERLDSLGRTKDLNYSSTYSSAPTIFDAQFTYNSGGDLTSELVTQATVGGVTHTNDRSWSFTYDALHRLTGANHGHLNTSGQIDTSTAYRNESWWLDRLGGWSGDGTNPGQRIARLINGTTTTTDNTQILDQFNALKSLRKRTGSTVTTTSTARDGAGNLIYDGTYVYQYDAFNRLVQVNYKGGVTVQSNGTLAGTSGPWVKHFTYDGLGRLIRTQSPWPWPDTAPAAAQSERYYYDGYRRIQKVLIDPIALDDEKQPIKISKEVDLTRVNISYNATVDREYVWDPVDTDRILCQYYASSNPYYITTDETWTPTAQLDSAGHVTDQFTYDPYGTLLTYDGGGLNAPGVEMGHQGLFFDRLDVGLLNTDGSENPKQAVGAVGSYYNRARTYLPNLGRFLQADPYGTGTTVQGNLGWFYGGALMPEVPVAPDLPLHYGNGMNHYEYVGSSPLVRLDPLGLYSNDFLAAQLAGPGWSQGGVFMYGPRAARARSASRATGWARGVVKGAASEALDAVKIAAYQAVGAGYAHALYGQDGASGSDVLGATLYQIRERAKKQVASAVRNGAITSAIPGFGDLGLAVESSSEGEFFDTFQNVVNGAIGLIGEGSVDKGFKSAAERVGAIAVVAGGLYSGLLEYTINDVYNWGFGVHGKELYNLWDD